MKKLIALLLCVLLLSICALAETDMEKMDFTLTTVNGESFTLSDCTGKITLLNFWGTWCGWCVYEMPAINDLAVHYADDADVAIVTLNYGDDAETARRFLEENGYSNFIVPCDLNGEATFNAGVEGFPTTILFDQAGNISETVVGVTHKVDEICEYYIGLIEALK